MKRYMSNRIQFASFFISLYRIIFKNVYWYSWLSSFSLLSFSKAGYSRYIISHYTILIPVPLTAINITPKHII
jgi:hypothetical protein